MLRRHFWVLGAAVVLACALLAHSGAQQLASARSFELPPSAEIPPTRAAMPAPPRSKDGSALTERNIFCSTCVAAEPTPEVDLDGDEVPLTSLPLELLATSLSSVADESTATVRHRDSGQQGAYRVGDRLPGAGELRRISGREARFVNPTTGRLERVSLLADAPAPAPAPRTRATARAETGSPYEGKIRAAGDNKYEVDAALIKEVTANPMSIRGVRFAPHMENGEIQGMKLSYARAGSLPTALGLKRGDVVRSINGLDLTNPDALLEVYTRLRDQTRFSATVLRGGETVNLSYTVR